MTQILEYVWKAVRGILIGLGIFALLAATIGLTRWALGTSERTVFVSDSSKVKHWEALYNDAEKERQSLKAKLERMLGLRVEAKPTIYVDPKPVENQIKFELIQKKNVRDTFYYVHTYDFPLYGRLSHDKLTFYTVNPWLELLGSPSRKLYEWKRTANRFSFFLSPTKSLHTNAITVEFHRDPFHFDGIFIGAGTSTQGNYLGFDLRANIMETAYLRADFRLPYYAGVEAKLKLY